MWVRIPPSHLNITRTSNKGGNITEEKRVWFLAEQHCVYSRHEGGTGQLEGYTEEQLETDFKSAWLEKPHEHFFIDSIVPEEEITGENVYLVVARYTNGGTFGQTSGYYTVVAAFNENASASTWRQVNYDKYKRQYSGYFDSLDSLDVESVRIECAR